jgi:hypothetical protein
LAFAVLGERRCIVLIEEVGTMGLDCGALFGLQRCQLDKLGFL